MANITNLSWEIVIPPEIDWLVISPSRGTGYSTVNVNIIDGVNTDTEAEVTLYCTSCDSVVEKKLKILRCDTCGCGDFEIEKLDLCDCEKLTLNEHCDCENIIVDIDTLNFDWDEISTRKLVSVSKTCSKLMPFTVERDKDFIILEEDSENSNEFYVSVREKNTSNEQKSGQVFIKYNNNTCHTINVIQKGKSCNCADHLSLECKENCNN